MTDKIKVIITNDQKDIRIPTGVRMLVRRCCNAVLVNEGFEGSAEISVRFVNDEIIHQPLNRSFDAHARGGKGKLLCMLRELSRTSRDRSPAIEQSGLIEDKSTALDDPALGTGGIGYAVSRQEDLLLPIGGHNMLVTVEAAAEVGNNVLLLCGIIPILLDGKRDLAGA